MNKYISSKIKPEELKVETDRYFENNIRYETVRLTHIPTGIQKTAASSKSQVSAYNIALHALEASI